MVQNYRFLYDNKKYFIRINNTLIFKIFHCVLAYVTWYRLVEVSLPPKTN
jgi:hypothetical protein